LLVEPDGCVGCYSLKSFPTFAFTAASILMRVQLFRVPVNFLERECVQLGVLVDVLFARTGWAATALRLEMFGGR
jgi:hypothetical protein